jgi:hypothetical protein
MHFKVDSYLFYRLFDIDHFGQFRQKVSMLSPSTAEYMLASFDNIEPAFAASIDYSTLISVGSFTVAKDYEDNIIVEGKLKDESRTPSLF